LVFTSHIFMEQLKILIDLTRLNKPIGFMLLFWPCSWGLAFAYNENQDLNIFLYYLFLFFLGSVLMRSAGCVFNDIVDKDIDKRVERTKKRPIASGKITVSKSFIYVFLFCLIAFFILIQFNLFTIFLGLVSMTLAFAYPFMKRITYWPQLFLGLTFNWGLIMGYTAVLGQISSDIIILYFAAIFWTLGYDTIYGVQDINDDEIIGIKSTAIKFKKNIKLFVSTCYSLTLLLIVVIFNDIIGINYSTLLGFMFLLTLLFQIITFNEKNALSCLKAFKINNLAGLLMFFSILFIKI